MHDTQHTPELTASLLLAAYARGIFMMADSDTGEIAWYSPDPRGVLPLDEFHAPRSLRQVIRRGVFEIRIDTQFDAVLAACADREDGTWISPAIARVYRDLHRVGRAHSVEAWCDGALAGGLYGVTIGGAFFGESMFSRVSNASKAALAALVERMQARGMTLLDTQYLTAHLQMLGGREIPRRAYLRRLRAAIALPVRFAP